MMMMQWQFVDSFFTFISTPAGFEAIHCFLLLLIIIEVAIVCLLAAMIICLILITLISLIIIVCLMLIVVQIIATRVGVAEIILLQLLCSTMKIGAITFTGLSSITA